MQEDRPWRKPLQERQAYASTSGSGDWHPAGLSHKQWRELARADLEEMEGGLRGSVEGDAARFYLHRSTKEAEEELGQQYDKFEEKPLCRMSLQVRTCMVVVVMMMVVVIRKVVTMVVMMVTMVVMMMMVVVIRKVVTMVVTMVVMMMVMMMVVVIRKVVTGSDDGDYGGDDDGGGD